MKIHLRRNTLHAPMKCQSCKEEIKIGQTYQAEKVGMETHIECLDN